jgi:hypothetical protein
MSAQYAVLELAEDGSVTLWGPFSEARADAAANALKEAGSDTASAHRLWSSTDLVRELPWRRVA